NLNSTAAIDRQVCAAIYSITMFRRPCLDEGPGFPFGRPRQGLNRAPLPRQESPWKRLLIWLGAAATYQQPFSTPAKTGRSDRAIQVLGLCSQHVPGKLHMLPCRPNVADRQPHRELPI